jgi:hypothetical protein
MTIPRRDWFRMQPPSDLHGLGHTARVMVWASVLAHETPWFDAVLWAAACHDMRRHDDWDDPDHGFRAGRWVRRFLPVLLREVPADLELIASACDWHVCDDAASEFDHPVLWLLKDADGLDRVRLFDLEPAFLRHHRTHDWIEAAHRLFDATDWCEDPAQIWETAQRQGLPVAPLLDWQERVSSLLVSEEG